MLQTAIGPVILISGVGLLLLTMTNRLGRAIDRARILATGPAPHQKHIEAEVEILWKRAQILRLAILLAATSALCAALLIILIFSAALFELQLAWPIATVFVGAMFCLSASLIFFIRDINHALEALKLELHPHVVD